MTGITLSQTGQLPNRGFVLISPGSRKLSPRYIKRVELKAITENQEALLVIFLDTPEQRNQMLLRGLTEESAQASVSQLTNLWLSELLPLLSQTSEIRFQSDLLSEPDLQTWRTLLWNLYGESGSFRRNCLNQTFNHLRPVLRRFGIERKNNATVKALSSYVVEEVALLCFLASHFSLSHEYGPMPQMEIVESILAGKYSTLSDVGQTMVPYVQVPEEPVDFDDNWLNGVSLA